MVFHTTVGKSNYEEANLKKANIFAQKLKQNTLLMNKRPIEKRWSKHEDEEDFNLWRLNLSGMY